MLQLHNLQYLPITYKRKPMLFGLEFKDHFPICPQAIFPALFPLTLQCPATGNTYSMFIDYMLLFF